MANKITLTCQQCGVAFLGVCARFCPLCRTKQRRLNQYMDRTCKLCGKTFEGTKKANYCPGCRPGFGRKRRAVVLTEEARLLLEQAYEPRVKGRTAKIAKQLGWSPDNVIREARRLGLGMRCVRHTRWKPTEVRFVEKWAGVRSVQWIAKQLGRTQNQVYKAVKRFRLSSSFRGGYTRSKLSQFMGVSPSSVDAWLRHGLLRLDKKMSTPDRQIVSLSQVRVFLSAHRDAYELRQVNQEWFLSLVFDWQPHELSSMGNSDRKEFEISPEEIARRAAEVRVNGNQSAEDDEAKTPQAWADQPFVFG